LLETEFRIVVDDVRTVPVRLMESSALPPVMTGDDSTAPADPFCLVFEGNRDLNLEQRIYTVQSKELGTLELFLVPIGRGVYEAVFN
jgi:hypothetical protein